MEQCEWCVKPAVMRIQVTSFIDKWNRPYERFACPSHEQKTKRLVELDFGKRFDQIGAEVTQLEANG